MANEGLELETNPERIRLFRELASDKGEPIRLLLATRAWERRFDGVNIIGKGIATEAINLRRIKSRFIIPGNVDNQEGIRYLSAYLKLVAEKGALGTVTERESMQTRIEDMKTHARMLRQSDLPFGPATLVLHEFVNELKPLQAVSSTINRSRRESV